MELEEIHSSVLKAAQLISPYIFHTPLEHSLFLSTKTQANVYLKLESQQKTGSFKVRGAFNKLLMNEDNEKKSEYVTASTGNHGMASALAFTTLKKKGIVYVPTNVSPIKESNLRMYGVEVRKFGDDCVVTEGEARKAAKSNDSVYVSPYADMQIIFGQGTIGKELLDDLPNLNAVFVTVGGGGLVSGIGSYLKVANREIEIVGCSPSNAPVMQESVKAGRIVDLPYMDTLSDASAGGIEEGSPTVELCQRVVDKWIDVSEKEIASAMYLMLEKHSKVVEGAAGVALAAFIKCQNDYVGKNVAIVICGANVSMNRLQYIMNNH